MGGRRVVETLGRTGGFGLKVVRRRLLETYHYVLDVTRDVESIKPGGDGFAASVRVRFLHAAVRRRILALAKEQKGYYDVDEHGIPINDLDSIGTISTFSTSLIWLALPIQGILLRKQEVLDYLALWRYVAYLLGTPTGSFTSPEKARAMLESLFFYDLDPSDQSRQLAANILSGLAGQPPAYASIEFLRAEAYWLNRSRLASALHIPKPPLLSTMLVIGQCLFFMFVCYVRRSIPSWDAARIKVGQTSFLLLGERQGTRLTRGRPLAVSSTT
jgi:ribosomal protein S28E/S33